MKRVFLAKAKDDLILAVLTDEPTQEQALFEAQDAAAIVHAELIRDSNEDGFFNVLETEVSRDYATKQTAATVAGLLIGSVVTEMTKVDAELIKQATLKAKEIVKAAGL